MLFSTDPDALGWNVVRYNAGGTSPEADPKRFRPGGKVQVTLDADGSWHPERDGAQIECLRLARQFGANVFELFVNSPPYWMLKSGDTHGGAGGEENLKPELRRMYAAWLARVTERTEREAGLRFASIAPFNEPSAWWWKADGGGQEGCRIGREAQAEVLRALREELGRRSTKRIVACSDENEPRTGHATLDWLTDRDGAGLDRRTIGRVNVHGYSAWEWQERLRDLAKQRGIGSLWMSEVSHREWEAAGFVPNDMRCALPQTRSVVNDLKRLRPNAWVFWQAVEPLQFCVWYRFTYGLMQAAADEPVEWNGRKLSPGEFIVSKAFYAMMQFSRFIRPGYSIIAVSDFWTVAAISPDGRRLVLVTHNDTGDSRDLRFDLGGSGRIGREARRWRTRDDEAGVGLNCRPMAAIATDGRAFTDTIPPRSVTTYVVVCER